MMGLNPSRNGIINVKATVVHTFFGCGPLNHFQGVLQVLVCAHTALIGV
jgi:hypothetical protein